MCGNSESTRTSADNAVLGRDSAAERQTKGRSTMITHVLSAFATGRIGLVSALPLCLLLSACGGGGGRFPRRQHPAAARSHRRQPQPRRQRRTISGYSLKGTLDVQTSWLASPAATGGQLRSHRQAHADAANGDPTSYRATRRPASSLALANPNRPARSSTR